MDATVWIVSRYWREAGYTATHVDGFAVYCLSGDRFGLFMRDTHKSAQKLADKLAAGTRKRWATWSVDLAQITKLELSEISGRLAIRTDSKTFVIDPATTEEAVVASQIYWALNERVGLKASATVVSQAMSQRKFSRTAPAVSD